MNNTCAASFTHTCRTFAAIACAFMKRNGLYSSRFKRCSRNPMHKVAELRLLFYAIHIL